MIQQYVIALGIAVTWGVVYIIDQKVLERLSPMSLLVLNGLITIGLLIPYLFYQFYTTKDFTLQVTKSDFMFVLVGLLLSILANYLVYRSIGSIGATATSIFEISYPFFVVFFGFLLLGERINAATFMGGILIFLGSVVIIKFG